MTTPDEPTTPDGMPPVTPAPVTPPAPEWFPAGAAEHTQPLPYVEQPTEPSKPHFSRRAGVAAVIVAAIVGGGAAGVGGAVWANEWTNDNDAKTVDAPITAIAQDGGTPASTIEKVAAKVLPSVVEIKVTGSNASGSGSGIVLNSEGMILTNNHVVVLAANGGTIKVSTNNGRLYPAKLIGTDSLTDSAVIQVQGLSGLKPATMGRSSSLRVGQSVLAIGSPFGLSSTVTEGIVSALNRPVQVVENQQQQQSNPFDPFGQYQQQSPSQTLEATYPAIQTDAAINPGNSGGALVDLNGNVVGMNSSIETGSSGSSGSVGLGFAIPIDELLPIVNQIIHGEKPTHARMGVGVGEPSAGANQLGAVVSTVDANGAAAAAGIKPGDLITKVGSDVVTGADSLIATIRGHRPGDKVALTVIRGDKTENISVTLGSDAVTQKS